MTSSFGNFEVSLQARDQIKRIAIDAVQKERPKSRMATVVAIDRVNRTADVTFTGETSVVTVPYTSTAPANIGQFVWIGGGTHDRHVEDIVGESDIERRTIFVEGQVASLMDKVIGPEWREKPLDELPTSVVEYFDKVDEKIVEAKGTAVTATNTVTYVNKIYNVRSGRGLWESGPDPTGDPSFPFNDIATYIIPGPTGGFSCGANAHSHGGLGVSYNDQFYDFVSVSSTNAPWAFIRFSGAVEKRVLTYMAMKIGQVDGLYFDVYRLNPDGTASFIQSSNNEIGLIGTTQFIGQSTIPSSILVDIGDVLAIQIRVVGSGSVSIPAKKMMNYGFLPSFVPRTMSAARDPSSNPTPATISAATMNSMYNYLIPWISFGMDLGVAQTPRSFADNFDRAELNASVRYLLFGPNGNTFTPYLEGNQFRPRGGTEGFQGIIYPQPLIGDDWFLEWRTRADTSTQPQGAYMGSSVGNGIIINAHGGGFGISTVTNMGNGSQNARYADGRNFGYGLYRVEFNSTTKKLSYFWNNEYQGEFDDTSGNYIPRGPGNRFFGLFVSNFNFGNSDWVDDFSFGDIVRA